MSKKNKIMLIIFCVINFCATLCLTIFVMPNSIPFLIDLNERILNKISKWIMLIATIMPTIFTIIILTSKSKKIQFFLVAIFVLSLFENFLYFSYFCLSKNLNIGELHEIPIAVSIFMPISVVISIFSIKLKNQPYLSKPAINFKVTRETEFIWKQTQIHARDVYFATGIILFLASIVFCFVRYCIILLSIFVVSILISTIIVYNYSKSVYKKYQDMKKRQEIINKKKVKEE